MREEKATVAIDKRVRDAGLRPTRQRVALAELLFAKGDRHLSAEELHEEALAAGVPVSLATVYNALHQFTEAGLLRILAVEGSKTYFDTNTSDHHHFFIEGENRVFDIADAPVRVINLPRAAGGHGNRQCRYRRAAAPHALSGTPEFRAEFGMSRCGANAQRLSC